MTVVYVMANLTMNQLASTASAGGFIGNDVITATAIAMAESGGNPNATNTNTNGSTDKGLWQINSVNASALALGNPFDPVTNAKMARKVFGSQGWRAWVAYTNGAYKTHVDAASKAYVATRGTGIVPTVSVDPNGPIAAVADVPSSISAGFASFTGTLTKIAGNTATVIIAVVLLIIGIVILLRSPVKDALIEGSPVGRVASLAGGVATVKPNPDIKPYTGAHRK